MSEERIRCDFCDEVKSEYIDGIHYGVFGDEVCCDKCYNELSEAHALSLKCLLVNLGYAESTAKKKATDYIKTHNCTVYNKDRLKIGPYEIIDYFENTLLKSKRLKLTIRDKAEKTVKQIRHDFYANTDKLHFMRNSSAYIIEKKKALRNGKTL